MDRYQFPVKEKQIQTRFDGITKTSFPIIRIGKSIFTPN